MKSLLNLCFLSTLFSLSAHAAPPPPDCNGDLANYMMTAYAKEKALSAINELKFTAKRMRVFPHIQPDNSEQRDSLFFLVADASSEREVVGFVEFDRYICNVVPHYSGLVEGQDVPLP